jgi:hypothetical protein
MEYEHPPIINSETFVKFSDNDRCRVSRSRVQDFLDRGLMSQGDLVLAASTEPMLIRRRCNLPEIHRGVV